MKRFRILKIVFSLLILLVGMEMALQAAHFIHKACAPKPSLAHPGAPAILCVGDSHTYGVKVAKDESYPAQLQALLDQNKIAANVINAGIPGQNTSELRRAMPEYIARYRPAAVVVLSCSNNEWNRRDVVRSDLEDGVLEPGIASWPPRLWHGFISPLRSVRLAAYLWNRTGRDLHPLERKEDREGNVYFHDWRGKGAMDKPEAVFDRSLRDLHRIVDIIGKTGATPIFLTYAGQPFSPMGGANLAIRQAANSRGVTLVDIDNVIAPMFMGPDGKMDAAVHERLFLTEPGETHLAGPGYGVVAREVYGALSRLEAIKK